MDIEKQLQELKTAREDSAKHHSQMKFLIEAAKLYPQYRDLADLAAIADNKISELESTIRAAAVAEYESTKNKAVHPKVTVKIFKTFKIIDTKKVWGWAFGNLPAALKLDEKKIEKYALEFGEVEGTERGEEARAQIAAEL